MNEVYQINKEFLFRSKIFNITSISVEPNFDIVGSNVEGEFIVSGDYKLHEISINKEDFCFKIPFKHEIKSNVNLDSIDLEITDFDYAFNNEDELSIKIEYVVSGEEAIIDFADESSLDEFLEKSKAEVVDLREDYNDIDKPIMDIIDDDMIINKEEKIEEKHNETSKEDMVNPDIVLKTTESDNTYVKYHIHVVTASDTIESITKKYNISVNTLKTYNTFDSLELNMKLIVPCEE